LIRLTHVITGLGTGGAEVMLRNFLSAADRAAFDIDVVSLMRPLSLGEKIEKMGVPVTYLGLPGASGLLAPLRLQRHFAARRPHVVQTWMYHADFLGNLAARWAGAPPVVWGIHNSTLGVQESRRSTRGLVRVLAPLSRRWPARIVSCSERARDLHVARGYDAGKIVVIPNGFNVQSFRPDPAARADVRRELRLRADALLIGLVARFHPQKDHRNFLEAAGRVRARHPGALFVLCGDGVEAGNKELQAWAKAAGVEHACFFLGRREDVSRLTAALDVAVSASSHGEAFSLVVGEAMASGVPCAVTDVGDSAFLVGDAGRAAPPRNPLALAKAMEDLIDLGADGRRRLGEAARRRVETHFNLPDIARRYETLYKELATLKP